MRRVAAVDYGRRRIGLAVCDPLGLTVRGLDTHVRADGEDLPAAAAAVAARLGTEGVQAIVVGLPLHESGEESELSAEARRFADDLAAATGLEVEMHHEGLTSWEAEENLKARGDSLATARRSGALDREAACCLLRAWLREREGRTSA